MEAARSGDLPYFQGLPADQLAPLLRRKDEDERSLLHTACGSGNLELVQLLVERGAGGVVNDADEEVGLGGGEALDAAPTHAACCCCSASCPRSATTCRAGRPCTRPYRPVTSWLPACSSRSAQT